MNKLRAYFRVICTPIPSWSDISAQHFPSLPPGEPYFWRPEISSRRPEISSRRPEILYQLINRSVICTSSKFWLVHLGDDVRDASR